MAMQRTHGTRRVWVPAAVFGGFALVAFARLVQVQVLDHARYAQEARAELAGNETVFARRGSVLDRNGNVLAASVDTWDVYVSARSWQEPGRSKAGSEALAAALRMDAAQLRDKVQRGSGDVLIRTDVDLETGRDIAARSIDGVVVLPNTARINPDGDTGASVLGFIGRDNTGLAGIEAAYNEVLQGTPGKAIYERDTAGEPIPFGQHLATNPVAGKDLVLTIDRHLQQLAEQRLAQAIRDHRAKGGAIIMMDPSTGEILALATVPSLKYSTLDLNDPGQMELLRNRAVTDLYEPGSVMKVVTAAAAIDAGAVTPNTTYVDTGTANVYGIPIGNWDSNVYGEQSMTQVLQNSINTGAIFMQQALEARSPGSFQRYLDAFGFGHPSGIDLTGEAGGIIRRPTDPDWSPVDLATQAFGQSISVTPMQMISAVAAAINGGNLMRPRLVKAIISADGTRQDIKPQIVRRAISEATSATMRLMLEAVVNPGHFHPGKPRDYTAGGKSGTANVPIPNGYDDRQVASFIGFAPAASPRVLIMVKLDQNDDLMTGTQAAAPIVAKLIDDTLHYMNVRPDSGMLVEAP
jgi:cell division protein FtsI/penicillin-binding protein 2